MDKQRLTADVVVVGAGNAALTAALASRQAGAHVLVLEKATEALRGGNTRFSGGIFRFTYNGIDDLLPLVQDKSVAEEVTVKPYSEEDFINDIQRTAGGRSDAVLTKHMVSQSYDTVRWMAKLGVPWEFNRAVGTVSIQGQKTVLPFGAAVRAVHEGVGLSQSLFDLAEAAGIEIRYETDARKLVTDDKGRILGVEVQSGGVTEQIRCKSVILASGGFQANPEMRTAYLGPVWSLVKVRGTRFNTGSMIRAAIDAGAQPYGEFSGCHATPIDADAPNYGELALTDKTNRLSYPFGILINLDGKRFVDEGEDLNSYTYAKYGGEILKQRQAVAFQVFDSKTFHLLEKRYETGRPIEGNTFAELADKLEEKYRLLGFKKDAFVATIEEYNQAARTGEFNPNQKDGLQTIGLKPEKTNWALLIDKPPYRVYPVTGGITFTFGGIRIDTEARVLDYMDRPIPGLFSTGEMTGGFFYTNYPLGTGLTRGAVFGRAAGNNAAAFAREARG